MGKILDHTIASSTPYDETIRYIRYARNAIENGATKQIKSKLSSAKIGIIELANATDHRRHPTLGAQLDQLYLDFCQSAAVPTPIN